MVSHNMSKRIITPKKKKDNVFIIQNTWYNYYAGYSDSFILKYLKKYSSMFIDPIVLDPWTGSGTTNIVANYLNLKNIGLDINPVMIIISKAKLYDSRDVDIDYLFNCLSVEKINKFNQFMTSDYLFNWYDDDTVEFIRKFEALLQIEILSFNKICPLILRNINLIDSKTAFYYLILFKTVKSFSKSLIGSNPTWIKTKNITNKIIIDSNDFIKEFITTAQQLKNCFVSIQNLTSFGLSDSKNTFLNDESIDIVLTSPPYCTRIDYVVLTIIELSIIGFSKKEIINLRKSMIGTTKILSDMNFDNTDCFISEKVKTILKKIKYHDSKASQCYYYKTYYQYFINMQESINEINRITKKNGIVMFIVQDSYFKDIFINLKRCLVETFSFYNFSLVEAIPFKVSNNMRYLNTNSRKYKDKVKVYEKILVFRKE